MMDQLSEDERYELDSGDDGDDDLDSASVGYDGRPCGSQAEKRAHHNALERKRRDHIKDSFCSLRDTIPTLQGEKSSRAQILKKAADYIQFMRKKNSAHLQDIEDLRQQNCQLGTQIRSLDVGGSDAAAGGGMLMRPAFLPDTDQLTDDSEEDGVDDDEDADDDDVVDEEENCPPQQPALRRPISNSAVRSVPVHTKRVRRY